MAEVVRAPRLNELRGRKSAKWRFFPSDVLPLPVAEMTGTRGGDWELLTAGAFVSILVPVAVFFALQRYFVRGLLAGSVKG